MQGIPQLLTVSQHARARWAERADRPPTIPVADALELPADVAAGTHVARRSHPDREPSRIALCGLAVLLIRRNTVVTVLPLGDEDLALVLTWFLLGEVV